MIPTLLVRLGLLGGASASLAAPSVPRFRGALSIGPYALTNRFSSGESTAAPTVADYIITYRRRGRRA